MTKYRITNESKHDFSQMEFFIERKGLFGWRRVKAGENGDYRDLTFGSYVEAERHMKENYFRDGHIYQPKPNEYHYQRTVYYGY